MYFFAFSRQSSESVAYNLFSFLWILSLALTAVHIAITRIVRLMFRITVQFRDSIITYVCILLLHDIEKIVSDLNLLMRISLKGKLLNSKLLKGNMFCLLLKSKLLNSKLLISDFCIFVVCKN